MNHDISEPSEAARKELNMPEYLRACDVVGRFIIRDATVAYEVLVGDWIVWRKVGHFGRDDAHRAGGEAFRALSQEQEKVMHDWADKIMVVAERLSDA
jgi:hypothetical protein